MAPRNTICRRCTLRDTSSCSRWLEEMSKLTKCRSSLINHFLFLYICRVLNYVSTFFIDHSENCDLQKVSDHKLGKIWALWLALSPFLGIIWSQRLITTGRVCLFWNSCILGKICALRTTILFLVSDTFFKLPLGNFESVKWNSEQYKIQYTFLT